MDETCSVYKREKLVENVLLIDGITRSGKLLMGEYIVWN